MDDAPPRIAEIQQQKAGAIRLTPRVIKLAKWCAVLLAGSAILLLPTPAGITSASWRLLAIFAATVVGLIVQPMPGGAIVLMGISVLALTGTLSPTQALAGYADPLPWLLLTAFFISRGIVKTGLGRRIAFLFIRAIGHTSLGLGYALVFTDMLLGMLIPSNGARAGGIIFPITRSLAEAYDSRPGPTARRLGALLMTLVYQGDVIICAMFLTGQSSNVLISNLARQATGINLSYARWALGALLPGLVCLAIVPLLIYRLFPPEVRHTPGAAGFAEAELVRMGPMSRREQIMLAVFAMLTLLWMTGSWHSIDYTMIGLVGICVLLISGVLEWEDVTAERGGWDVFIWFGGLVLMAKALGETGITKWFAESAASLTVGWQWWSALAVLLLIYFYAHYGFASITAHASAMYIPFLVVTLTAGTPKYLAALSLAYFSNLAASLTHYGTTPAPIYYGAGYVNQRTWWRLGLSASVVNIVIWVVVGFTWWKVLGWW